MKRVEIDCDRCEAECTGNSIHISIPIGWERDPSGHGGDHIYRRMDICPKCAERALGILLSIMDLQGRKVDYKLAKKIVAEIYEMDHVDIY